MRTLASDNINGLLLSTTKSLFLNQDLDALRDKVTQRLRFFLGEWFLDTTQGVPYLQQIFATTTNTSLIVSILNNEILKESDVTSIESSSNEYNSVTREFFYSATLNTIYGTTTVSTSSVVATV